MRILVVTQYFWPENFRINDLVAELREREHEVTVLTGKPNYPDGEVFAEYRANPRAFASFAGARIVRVPMMPRGQSSIRLVLNYLSFAASGLWFGAARLRGEDRFDAIFVFQTSPITAALPALRLRRRFGAPVLMWVLDLWPDTLAAIGVVKSPTLLALVGRLVRYVYARCDRILVQSRAFEDNVRRFSDQPEKLRYLPGWPESVFEGRQVADPAPEFAPWPDDFKIVFAGNIGQAQDFPAIIAAADLLRGTPGLRWLIVGDGRAAENARQEVRRRGLEDRVIFLGRFPIDRMPAFFAGADALLVSLRDEPIWSMTIPGKVQSYLSAGRPILAMLNGEGARVVEESGGGLAGAAGDSAALATNVRRLMTMSPEERLAMGRRGVEYCEREFNRATLVDRLEGWIAELRDPASLRAGADDRHAGSTMISGPAGPERS